MVQLTLIGPVQVRIAPDNVLGGWEVRNNEMKTGGATGCRGEASAESSPHANFRSKEGDKHVRVPEGSIKFFRKLHLLEDVHAVQFTATRTSARPRCLYKTKTNSPIRTDAVPTLTESISESP